MKKNLPATGVLLGLLLLWQVLAMFMAKPYILPTPTAVLRAVWHLRGPLFTIHLPATAIVVLAGFTISFAAGLLLAMLMDRYRLFRQAFYPLVVISQTIPVTAIAPLFILWFGYGYASKIVVTVLMTFFAVTVTVYDGLQGVKREQVELLRTMGASSRDIFRILKWPTALPSVFSSLKMAVPISIIGAAIGEWLGAQRGLGFFSRRMMTQLNGPAVFAPILIMSVAAVAAVALVKHLEKRFVKGREEL